MERVYTFAHTDRKGKGIAQAKIPASSPTVARLIFKREYPQRESVATGALGVG